MKNLSPEFCRKVKDARKAAGIRQSELAAEVGCKQSAISMFEQGGCTKLNDDVIEKLAKKFGIEIIEASPSDNACVKPPVSLAEPHTGYCPNPNCPSHQRYTVDERMLRRPDRALQDPVGGRYCAVCGELLERACPNCGAPVHDGAVCSLCGEPYIPFAN